MLRPYSRSILTTCGLKAASNWRRGRVGMVLVLLFGDDHPLSRCLPASGHDSRQAFAELVLAKHPSNLGVDSPA